MDQVAITPSLSGGYNASFFDELALVEDRHFWFRSRNFLIYELARKICSDMNPRWVLEVGCGTGNALRVLRKAFREADVVGLELWFEGLRYAQSRSAGFLVQGDVRSFPFRNPFEVVCMFDVLEHIPEDRGTLRALRDAIAPAGKLLMTVPAHQFLWSYFDEAAQHCRRYSPLEIRTKLGEAGFELEYLSQFMAITLPLLWAFRKLNNLWQRGRDSKRLASKEFRIIPVLNNVLTAILRLEARWLARGHTLPFGSSLVIIARRA